MRYDPHKHHRRSIRLKGYDYAWPGAYFVTICTQGHLPFFENDAIRTIAERCWTEIPQHIPTAGLDEWVLMPNHLHGIIVVARRRGVQLNAPTRRNQNDPFSTMSPRQNTVAVVVRTYKAAVTTRCRRAGYLDFGWQRNYHERIIRNEDELNRVRQYIHDNPLNWESDEYSPNRADVLYE